MSATMIGAAQAAPAEKRKYVRKAPTPRRIALNPYQADFLLAAVKAEICRVREERGVPESLRILALAELRGLVAQLGDPVAMLALMDSGDVNRG